MNVKKIKCNIYINGDQLKLCWGPELNEILKHQLHDSILHKVNDFLFLTILSPPNSTKKKKKPKGLWKMKSLKHLQN